MIDKFIEDDSKREKESEGRGGRLEGSSGIKREGNKRERKGGVEGRIREREEEKERREG